MICPECGKKMKVSEGEIDVNCENNNLKALTYTAICECGSKIENCGLEKE